MSHELTLNKITGQIEMGYATGVDRWHGLGNEWLETDSRDEKIRKSGMAWEAMRARVRYQADQMYTVNDSHVLYRSDTKEPLGIVSPKFQIVQPREAIEFMEELADIGGYKLKTAGTLYGGKKFWAAAEIGEDAAIVGKDRMVGFLNFYSRFDGGSTHIFQSSICIVCDNTLRAALGEDHKLEVKITHRTKFDASKVRDQLGLATGEFAKLVKAARDLAGLKVDSTKAEEFVKSLLVDVADLSVKKIEDGKSTGFNKVLELFNGAGKGATLQGRKGTAWGLVNAVTEYVDHHAEARSAETRMDNAMTGDGDRLKTAALERALALL